jgi:uncharacterized protein (TIGR00369 family)
MSVMAMSASGEARPRHCAGAASLSLARRRFIAGARKIGASAFGRSVMAADETMRDTVVALNASAAFNRQAGFEVVSAGSGTAELRLPWHADLGQYAGFLHAAMIAGMIDTACGFAAYTVAGDVLASHFSVNCLALAAGDSFVARAAVVKAGRSQVFVHAELFASSGGDERLVATGDAILVPVGTRPLAAPAEQAKAVAA